MKRRLGHLNKREQKVVQSFVKELRQNLGEEIISVRLFGSKVRGDFEKYSDIDVFILVKKSGYVRDKISDIAADYFFEYKVPGKLYWRLAFGNGDRNFPTGIIQKKLYSNALFCKGIVS